MPTDPKVANLMFLRDVIIPYTKEKEKEGKVDFMNVECRTTKCLWGWVKSAFPHLGLYTMQRELTTGDVFGVTNDREFYSMFGTASNGTLDDRAAAIDRIIERKLQEAMP